MDHRGIVKRGVERMRSAAKRKDREDRVLLENEAAALESVADILDPGEVAVLMRLI